jgi:hypothetical protein
MEDIKTTEATEDKVEKTVEEELAAAQARIAELEAKLAEKEEKPELEVEMAMGQDSKEPKKEEEDYMKSAPAPVVKMIEDLRKQAESEPLNFAKSVKPVPMLKPLKKQRVGLTSTSMQRKLDQRFVVCPKLIQS